MTKLFDLTPFSNRVLIVDDEPSIGRLLTEVASHNGFEAVTVTNAEDALPAIENQRFGALIVDKNLPGIDGVELMRAMRVMQPHCACVMVTAFASRDSAIEAVHLGAADYITKPFDDVFLVGRRLARAVARHRLEYETQQVREQAHALLGRKADAEAPLGDLLNDLIGHVLEASLEHAGAAGAPEALLDATLIDLRAGAGG